VDASLLLHLGNKRNTKKERKKKKKKGAWRGRVRNKEAGDKSRAQYALGASY